MELDLLAIKVIHQTYERTADIKPKFMRQIFAFNLDADVMFSLTIFSLRIVVSLETGPNGNQSLIRPKARE